MVVVTVVDALLIELSPSTSSVLQQTKEEVEMERRADHGNSGFIDGKNDPCIGLNRCIPCVTIREIISVVLASQ